MTNPTEIKIGEVFSIDGYGYIAGRQNTASTPGDELGRGHMIFNLIPL